MSEIFEYLKFDLEEITDIIVYSIVLALMFSLSEIFGKFTLKKLFEYSIYILIIIFIYNIFIKVVAYYNGFTTKFYLTYVDRYGIKEYQKFSYYVLYDKTKKRKKAFKGIPSIFISIFLYILTATFIIYSGLFKFKKTIIPHKFIGMKKKYELFPMINISDYRYTITLFSGFLFLTSMIIFLKFIKIQDIYTLSFITSIIILGNLIPIPNNIGFELFLKNKFLWLSTLVILVIAISLLIINNFILYLCLLILSVIIILISYLWKEIIG